MSLGFVWDIYNRMRRRKATGLNGYVPLEWTDIDAFLRVSRVWLPSWAVPLIEELDDIFLQSQNEANAGTPAEQQQSIRDGVKAAGKRAQKHPETGALLPAQQGR